MGTRPEDELRRLLKGRRSGGHGQDHEGWGARGQVRTDAMPPGDRWLHPEGHGEPMEDLKQAGDMK